MRKLLNTLHVMTQGAYLHRDGETVAVKVAQELKLRVPVPYPRRAGLLGAGIMQSACARAVLRAGRGDLVSD